MTKPHQRRAAVNAADVVVTGAHGLVLGLAAIVPIVALADAALWLWTPSGRRVAAGALNLARWLHLLGNTAIVTGVATALAVGVALVLGFLIARTDLPGRRVLAAVLVLGACLPVYVLTVAVFAAVPLGRWSGSCLAAGVLHGVFATPLATLVFAAAYRQVDTSLEEQARLDAGAWRVWRHVTAPLTAWAIAAVLLIVTLLVGADITVTDALIVRTFAEEVYTQYQAHLTSGPAVLTALPMLLLAAGLLAVYQRGLGERVESCAALPRHPYTFALGRWRYVGLATSGVLVLAPSGAALVLLAGKIEALGRMPAAFWSVKPELDLSLLLGAAVATMMVGVSVGIGVLWRRGGWTACGIGAALVLLMAAPAPVVGISLIWLCNRPGWLGAVYDSPAIIAVGHSVRFLPFAVLLLTPAVRRVARELILAARIDGCGWTGVWRHVYWPAAWCDAALAWLIVMILSFGEVAIATLVAPPGATPAAVRAFTLLHFGVYEDLAVLALAAVVYLLAPWLLLLAVWRWRSRGLEAV